MTVWKAQKTDVVNLDRYNMIMDKRADGSVDRYFVGNDIDRYGARISTAIQEYDEKTKEGVTASGTKYCLHGEPRLDADGMYLVEQSTDRSITSFTFRW